MYSVLLKTHKLQYYAGVLNAREWCFPEKAGDFNFTLIILFYNKHIPSEKCHSHGHFYFLKSIWHLFNTGCDDRCRNAITQNGPMINKHFLQMSEKITKYMHTVCTFKTWQSANSNSKWCQSVMVDCGVNGFHSSRRQSRDIFLFPLCSSVVRSVVSTWVWQWKCGTKG